MMTLLSIGLLVVLLILMALLISLVIFLIPGVIFVVALAFLIAHVAQAMDTVVNGWSWAVDTGWWHCAMQWMNNVSI